LWDPGGGRSFNFAAGSRSHRGFFYGNLDFPDKRLQYYFIIIFPGQYNAMAASAVIDLTGGEGLDTFWPHNGNFFIVDLYPKG